MDYMKRLIETMRRKHEVSDYNLQSLTIGYNNGRVYTVSNPKNVKFTKHPGGGWDVNYRKEFVEEPMYEGFSGVKMGFDGDQLFETDTHDVVGYHAVYRKSEQGRTIVEHWF